jgi:putative oxidoreductase
MFFFAGLGKLQDPQRVIDSFANLGIPLPTLSAYLVGLTELIGGACLVLGLASRLAALLLSIVMIVALFTAHFDGVKAAMQEPIAILKETPFPFLMALLVIFAFGPGKISLDYLLRRFIFNPEDR